MSDYAGGSKPHALYGVWIDEALKSNDVNQMKQVLQEARKHFSRPSSRCTAYGFITASRQGSSRDELQQLLEQAKAVKNSDLDGAIKKLEAHLGKSS